MEVYNKYLRTKSYSSEIAFVDSGIFSCSVFFVEFHDGMRGFYRDKNQSLRTLEHEIRRTTRYNKPFRHETIRNISSSVRNYCLIKIIKDNQHPELEGDIMMFYFGKQITDVITKYGIQPFNNKSFKLKIGSKSGFPTYEDSFFTDNDVYFKHNINVEQLVNIPFLDIDKIIEQKKRKEKLEYIEKQTNLKKNIVDILEQDGVNEEIAEKIINLIIDI